VASTTFNLEKAVNHGEHGAHGEKTATFVPSTYHPWGEAGASRKLLFFRRVAVIAVVQMRF
jgi:hypothetical protein